MYFDIRKRGFSALYQDRVFGVITLATMGVIVVDVIASIVMEYCSIWWLYQAVMVLYFATLIVLPVLWCYYIVIIIQPKLSRKNRITVGLCAVPVCLYVLVCLSNPISGLLFTLSADMVYTRGPLFATGTLLLVLYCVMTLIVIVKYRRRIVPRSRAWLFFSFFLIVGIGVFIQLAIPGMLLINAAYTIVFIMAYYYIQNRRTIIDGLTGIYNRSTGEQCVYDYIKYHAIGSGAFIITDIDNFKTVNDTMGHRLGDLVLKCLSDAFKEAFPHDAILSRLGGDEFMILIDDYGSREQLEEILNRINPTLQEKLKLSIPSGSKQITVSMGVSLFPEDGNTFAELYEHADIALYQAKWSGKNRFEFFDPNGDIKSIENPVGRDEGQAVNINDMIGRMSTESQIKTMLIVDDAPIDRTILSEIFKNDYIILHAEDCDSALRLMRRYGTSITVVLLDLMMPGKNGFDFLCEKNRSTAIKNIPVLVITASDDPKDKAMALNYGADEVIQKPINPEIVMLKTENVLAKYSTGFWYNDIYQRELLNLANLGINGGVVCVFRDYPDYTVEYISHSLLKLLGYDNLQEMLDATDSCWRNCMVVEDYERVAPLLEERFAQGGEYSELEYRLIRKDGSTVWIRDNGKLMTSGEGVQFIIGICISINMAM